MIIIHNININDNNEVKRSLENRIATTLILILAFASFGLASTYYFGSKSIEENNKIKLVENEQYAITYSDGDKYILHKVKLSGTVVTLNRNEQKVINNENCIYTVRHVDKIIVSD